MHYKALIIDDDGMVRRLTMRALATRGFECVSASTATVAREVLKQERFDLVVADLIMPGENGYGLVCQLVHQQDRPTVAVLTGVIEPRLESHLRHLGIDDVAFKPVDYRAFANHLVDLVSARQPLLASPSIDRLPAQSSESTEAADLASSHSQLTRPYPSVTPTSAKEGMAQTVDLARAQQPLHPSPSIDRVPAQSSESIEATNIAPRRSQLARSNPSVTPASANEGIVPARRVEKPAGMEIPQDSAKLRPTLTTDGTSSAQIVPPNVTTLRSNVSNALRAASSVTSTETEPVISAVSVLPGAPAVQAENLLQVE